MGVYEDLPVTSVVSGNVIDICPVGALTDNKYRFTARVWEMQETQGPCTLCSVGCRQGVWTKDGEIKRVTAAENEKINDTWICDVARYGWSGAHGEGRITQPMIRKDGELTPVGWAEAIGEAARGFGALMEQAGGGAIAGLGGASSTNETAYQFGAFMRSVLGTNHLDSRIHTRDIVQTDLQRAAFGGVGGVGSIEELGRSKAIIIVGSDPFTQHPILALQIRKAHRAGAVIINVNQRRIDLRVQGRVHHLAPVLGGISRTLRALATYLVDGGAKPEGANAEQYATLLDSLDLNRLCEEADVASERPHGRRPGDSRGRRRREHSLRPGGDGEGRRFRGDQSRDCCFAPTSSSPPARRTYRALWTWACTQRACPAAIYRMRVCAPPARRRGASRSPRKQAETRTAYWVDS